MLPLNRPQRRELALKPLQLAALLGAMLLVVSFDSQQLACAADEEALVQWRATFDKDILGILKSRCLDCHNDENAEGEFSLAEFTDGAAAAQKMDLWDRVGKRIRLNEMPPQGSPGLNDPQKGALQRWLDTRPQEDRCDQLASDETQSWYRGHVMSRRLTTIEYRNAIRDLFGMDLPEGIEIPSDGAGGEGFDTVGDTLFTSALHFEAYLQIADLAVGARWMRSSGLASGDEQNGRTKEALPESAWTEIFEREPLKNEAEWWDALQTFAKRAWRRPLSEDEIVRLRSLYNAARQNGGDAIQAVGLPIKAILTSPHFLFVVERQRGDGVQPLSPHEYASRLALFLWSSLPDETLLRLADSGELVDPDVVKAQVKRMLADPRSRSLGEHFGLQWLGISDLERKIQPDNEVVTDFDRGLIADLREEAIRTIREGLCGDEPLERLLSADYVFVNERLAKYYGIEFLAGESVAGSTEAVWQKISVDPKRRGGVITMGSVLASTAYPRRTSPVLRGQWILSEVLGAAVPPPPPGIPALDETTVGEKPQSLRARLEAHRLDPQCASCHDRMDPLGFGLENYDLVGRWREAEGGLPIDASGKLPSGQTFDGPFELKEAVLSRRDEFRKHFLRKLLGFALGRSLNKFDNCVLDDCAEALEASGGKPSAAIETICLSYPFGHRYFSPSETK